MAQTIMNNSRGAHGEQPRSDWQGLYDTLSQFPAAPPLPPSRPAPAAYPAPSSGSALPPPPSQPGPTDLSHLSAALYNPQALEQIYNPPTQPPETPPMVPGQPLPPAGVPPTKGSAPYFAPPMQANKIQKKVYFPLGTGINYIGLLIGPKGMYQKKLEEQTNCKILIRGKYLDRASHRGGQKDRQHSQNETDEEQHVLVSPFCFF